MGLHSRDKLKGTAKAERKSELAQALQETRPLRTAHYHYNTVQYSETQYRTVYGCKRHNA